MYRIGVTGKIASGKTTLTKYLATFKHVHCINLDLAAHKLYESDYYLRKALATRFGPTILSIKPNGLETVNRAELGKIAFSDPDSLKSLNSIVHPCVFKYLNYELDHMTQMKKSIRPDILFVEGAVIIEAGWGKYFDEIWVTTLPKKEALERLLNRNKNLPKEQAEKRVNMQISDEERVKQAKFWYDTVKPFEENVSLIMRELERLKAEGKLRDIAQKEDIGL